MTRAAPVRADRIPGRAAVGRGLLAAVLCALVTFAMTLQGAGVAEMRVGREPDRTRIVLDLPGPTPYTLVSQGSATSAVFELEGITLSSPLPLAEFRATPVRDVQVTYTPDGTARLAITLARDDLRLAHFPLAPAAGRGHRLVIDVYEPGNGRDGEPVPVVAAVDEARAQAAAAQPLAPKPAPVTASASRPWTEEPPAPAIAVSRASGAEAPPVAAASDSDSDLRPLPGGGADGLVLTPRGYAEFSSAYTWPGEDRWSKLRSRLEYGADGRFDNGVSFRMVARAEVDAAYIVEDDFYPQPVIDDQRTEVTLREAYFDLPAGDWEFRLGRQHVVWGEMVGLFLADVVSAKDTREFYLQDFEAIRLPQWAVRAERYGANSHLELLYVPYPTYDNVGRPGANFYPFPQLTGPVPQITPERSDFANHGYGARYSKLVDGWDLSSFYYRSTDVAPTLYQAETGPELRHDRIQQVGVTFSKDLRGLVLKGEAVYTHGRAHITQDPTAALGVSESDVLDYIVGLTLPRGDWNFDVQLYASHRFDHENGMLYDANEFGATAMAGYQFGERLEAQLLYLTGFNRTDQSIQGWVGWRFAPSWRLRAGIDWFDGDDIGFFGRYDAQDRMYLELKRWF